MEYYWSNIWFRLYRISSNAIYYFLDIRFFKIHLLLMSQISSWPGNLRRLQASSAKAYTTKDLYLGYSLVGPAGLFKHHHRFAVICSNLFDDVWWFVACHCCKFTAKYSGQEVTESWRPNLWVKSQGQLSWVGQVGPIHGSSTVFGVEIFLQPARLEQSLRETPGFMEFCNETDEMQLGKGPFETSNVHVFPGVKPLETSV